MDLNEILKGLLINSPWAAVFLFVAVTYGGRLIDAAERLISQQIALKQCLDELTSAVNQLKALAGLPPVPTPEPLMFSGDSPYASQNKPGSLGEIGSVGHSGPRDSDVRGK